MILILRNITLLVSICLVIGCSSSKEIPIQDKPEMVFVKGGTFTMGDISDTSNTDALPLHSAHLKDYYIGRKEVTYQQYDAFARATGRPLPKDQNYGRGQRAVVFIDWYSAQSYCKYWGWRLPTEPEWEYAARSRGKITRYAGTNNRDSLKNYAIIHDADINFAYWVATRAPNELGLFDMSGNVLEMVSTFYQDYKEPTRTHNLNESSLRIIRGGSFDEEVATNQTFWRIGTYDKMIHSDVGFRCAVSQEELDKQRFLNGIFHIKAATP